MTKLQENVCACAPLPSQYAAIEALSGKENYSKDMVATFTSRRNVLVKGINKVPNLKCVAPQATFYLMVDISATGMSSEEFAISLLQEAHVAVVPGITYGKSCDKYVRIAFTLDEVKIQEGVRRIAKYMNERKQ
jgi:aminotransferase